jgi:hypothetical protein
MEPLRFFDAHVAVGPRRVPSWGPGGSAADVFARLRECGIEEALVYSTASVEHHPAVGNAVALLCADEAAYINGVGIIVDRGHQAVCV